MQSDTADLAGLVSARICHDLISPIGAAGNGLELLSLASANAAQNSPEMALISASLAQAQARLQFFRLAFGAADTGADMAHKDLSSLLQALGRDSRLRYHCQPCAPVPRPVVQLICLSLLCLEGALPSGGTLGVASDGPDWQITACGEKLHPMPHRWALLTGPDTAVHPRDVQFSLLRSLAEKRKIALTLHSEAQALSLHLRPGP